MNTKDIPYAIPPGQFILEELEARGIEWDRLAREIGDFGGRDELLAGSAVLTPEVAERLAKFFEMDAKVWLRMEERFREAVSAKRPILNNANGATPVQKSASGKLLLRIPVSLHNQASDLAVQEDVSLNQLLMSYIADGVGRSEQRTGK